MIFLDRHFPHARAYKGGSPAAQQIQQAPIPLPAPPVTQNNQAVLQAEHDFATQNMMKKSVRKTIVAGDTGGFQAPKNAPAVAGPTGPAGPRF